MYDEHIFCSQLFNANHSILWLQDYDWAFEIPSTVVIAFTYLAYPICVYVNCYFGASSNKQLKQDMHTLMGKLKQQQQSSAAVSSSLLCTVYWVLPWLLLQFIGTGLWLPVLYHITQLYITCDCYELFCYVNLYFVMHIHILFSAAH